MRMENEKDTSKEESIVRETWGAMSFGKKLEYLWMYYKSWLFAAVIVGILLSIGVSAYRNAHTTVLLNAVIIGGDNLKAEWAAESFAEYAGITDEDGIVQIRTNIPDDGGSMTSTTSLTTLMGADAVDVLVCPKYIYDDYASQNAFLPMEDLPGEKSDEFIDAFIDSGVHLPDGNLFKKEQMTTYDDIYVAVPVNCQNPEIAIQFIEYLLP